MAQNYRRAKKSAEQSHKKMLEMQKVLEMHQDEALKKGVEAMLIKLRDAALSETGKK